MLTLQEKVQQSIELNENLQISGLSKEAICSAVKISPQELEAVFAMTGENPTAVWMVRDYMDEKIKEQGKKPRRYSKGTVNIYFPYKKTW